MTWWDGGPGTGGWILMSLIMVAFWGLLLAAGVFAWRSVDRDRRRDSGAGPGRSTAQQVLDERFARGEIDEDDYRHRDELLRSGR
jgi:putative membrane protein